MPASRRAQGTSGEASEVGNSRWRGAVTGRRSSGFAAQLGWPPGALVGVSCAHYAAAFVEPLVHLRGVVVLLGRFPALAGVDLEVEPGEIVLLRGPNGAGKTTLLRTLAGLMRISEGEASVLGRDLRGDRRSLRRRVAFLGHATGLYDELGVEDNVVFWARAGGADVHDARDALKRVAVEERLYDVAVGKLSTGQRRRVALACLVARRPQLWLLDEPHAGLDQHARDLVDALMVEASEAGATVLFASHELERAAAVAMRDVTVVGGVVHDSRQGGAHGTG